MAWICKREIRDDILNVLFSLNIRYEEYDDRGDADDIAICLVSDMGQKTYLIDKMVREHFYEVD